MRFAGCLIFLAALVATVVTFAGCGEDAAPGGKTADRSERPAPNVKQRQVVRDPVGDVLVKAAGQRGITSRKQLDLLSVGLVRTKDELVVSFLTDEPPGPGMVEVLKTYDKRQLVEGQIEIRFLRDGEIRAVHRPARAENFKTVPVKVVGREAVVRVPLSKYTRELEFKWRAHTVSTRPTHEIRDRVPTRVNDIAFFPGYQ